MLTLAKPIPTGTLVGIVLRDPEGVYSANREIRLQADVIDDHGAVYATHQLSVADERCVGLRVNETPTGPGDRIQRFGTDRVRGAYDRALAVMGEVHEAKVVHAKERQAAIEAAEAAEAAVAKNREASAKPSASTVPVPEIPKEPDLMGPLASLLVELGLLPAVTTG